MKVTSYISVKEKRLFILVTFFVLFLTVLNIGSIVYEDSFKNNAIEFSSCGELRTNFVHYFRVLSLLIFAFILAETKYVFSFLTTFLGFSAFAYENYYCFNRYFENDWKISLIEVIGLIARPLDYFVFLLISILLVWQISILFRILTQSLKTSSQLT